MAYGIDIDRKFLNLKSKEQMSRQMSPITPPPPSVDYAKRIISESVYELKNLEITIQRGRVGTTFRIDTEFNISKCNKGQTIPPLRLSPLPRLHTRCTSIYLKF